VAVAVALPHGVTRLPERPLVRSPGGAPCGSSVESGVFFRSTGKGATLGGRSADGWLWPKRKQGP
jgi:hypothetical protein